VLIVDVQDLVAGVQVAELLEGGAASRRKSFVIRLNLAYEKTSP
jgi:hypothetical protein